MNPTCPNCGDEVTTIATPDGQTPPYGCFNCSRGWWAAELTAQMRTFWESVTRSFVSRDGRRMPDLAAAIRSERAARNN